MLGMAMMKATLHAFVVAMKTDIIKMLNEKVLAPRFRGDDKQDKERMKKNKDARGDDENHCFFVEVVLVYVQPL